MLEQRIRGALQEVSGGGSEEGPHIRCPVPVPRLLIMFIHGNPHLLTPCVLQGATFGGRRGSGSNVSGGQVYPELYPYHVIGQDLV